MKRLACILVCLATAAHAQRVEIDLGIWEMQPGLTSAYLARSQWIQKGAAGLSWPDGRQAVISYWEIVYQLSGEELRSTVRCVTYFDTEMQETGDICSSPVPLGNQ